jgi:cell division protease FtsH
MQPWYKQLGMLVGALLIVSLVMSGLQGLFSLGMFRALLVLGIVALAGAIVWTNRPFFIELKGGPFKSRTFRIGSRVVLVGYMLSWAAFAGVASGGGEHSGFLFVLFIVGLAILMLTLARSAIEAEKANRKAGSTGQREQRYWRGLPIPEEDELAVQPANGSTKTFADVAGCPEAIAELKEVVEFLQKPHLFERFGARVPRGVLLVGDPGTGKTLLAKAVAGEAGAKFIACAGSDFVEMYVGVGASRIREKFREARSAEGPAIIFIDEIDAVGKKRASGVTGGHQEWDQTLNALLVEMDGFPNDGKVIVIAATNRLDVLDPALTRPGRFDRHVLVPLPDLTGREQIFKVHMQGKPLAPGIDFKRLAERTFGFSGAEIAAACNEAAFVGARRYNSAVQSKQQRGEDDAAIATVPAEISLADVDEGIERSRYGAARSSVKLTDWDKLNTAVHEVCHGLVTSLYKDGDPVQKLTILPRMRFLGFMQSSPRGDRVSVPAEYLLVRTVTVMAGRAGQEVLLGCVDSGASNDFQQGASMARQLVADYGMSSLGPIAIASGDRIGPELADKIDRAVLSIQNDCMNVARRLVREHKQFVIAATRALLACETMLASQWEELLVAHGIKAHQEPAPKLADVPVPEFKQLNLLNCQGLPCVAAQPVTASQLQSPSASERSVAE